MYERFSGLYDIGVSTADAMTRKITSDILATEIIREYIDTYDWLSKSEFTEDGVFILSGIEFYQEYQRIAERLINTPQDNRFSITHNSGVEITVDSTFEGIGKPFIITVTNNSERPAARNVTAVTLQGEISWSADPPIYILEPRFDIDGDTIISEKGYLDFFIKRESDFISVKLSSLYRI